MMEKNYDVLVQDRLYFGGAKDAEAAFDNEAVDMVIDVRVNGLTAEEQGTVGYVYKHLPIADEELAVAASIDEVSKGNYSCISCWAKGIFPLW